MLSPILYNNRCYNLFIIAGSCILYELASNMLQTDFYLIFLSKVVQKVLTSFRQDLLLLFNSVLNFKFLWISKGWEAILQIPKSLSSGNQCIQNFIKNPCWTQRDSLFVAKCWYVVNALCSFSDIIQQGKMEVPFHSFLIVF